MTRKGRLAAAAVACAVGVACGLFPDVGDLGGGDASVADVNASDGGVDASPDVSPAEGGAKCQGTAGPAMVAVDGFCIDSTEVTNAHYQAFLASAPDASLFPPTCTAWKTTFKQMVAPPPGSDDYPAVWLDWCDAYAYCAWAGKRLCGRIGGGPLAPGGMNDVTQDEWYVACSNVGAHTYPYGNSFDPNACNGPERDANAVLPPTSMPNCTGGVGGVSQMVGNADEWIDSCASGATGPDASTVKCERRSGSWDNPPGTQQTCTFNRTGNRSEEDSDIGFRCCADLAP